LQASGQSPHGEADFIESFHPTSVLDAGCGMGRVAMELATRGIDVVGADLDDDLLTFARRSQPSIAWVHANLTTMQLGRRFTIVAMPGNVMIFCRPSDRSAIVGTAANHLEQGGLLVAGFDVEQRPDALTLAEYDAHCTSQHFELAERWATWDREPYRGGAYAVSVHRLLGG
jgi:2-polyprenyl-3-methyl-5-hydroxy-6-metoxy-1,4-benzoquinol methylase